MKVNESLFCINWVIQCLLLFLKVDFDQMLMNQEECIGISKHFKVVGPSHKYSRGRFD